MLDTRTGSWSRAPVAGAPPAARFRHSLTPVGAAGGAAQTLLLLGGTDGTGAALAPALLLCRLEQRKGRKGAAATGLRLEWRPAEWTEGGEGCEGGGAWGGAGAVIGHSATSDGAGGVLLYGGLDLGVGAPPSY